MADTNYNTQLMKSNSEAWHTADAAGKKRLEEENKRLGAQQNAKYDPNSGKWSDTSGKSLYTPTATKSTSTSSYAPKDTSKGTTSNYNPKAAYNSPSTYSSTRDDFYSKYSNSVEGLAKYNNVDYGVAESMLYANLVSGGSYKGGGVIDAPTWQQMVADAQNLKGEATTEASKKGYNIVNGQMQYTGTPGQQGGQQALQSPGTASMGQQGGGQQQLESSITQTGSVMDSISQIGREFAAQSAEHATAVAAQYGQMVELLNQMEGQLMGQIREQMNGDDPAMQSAIGLIKQEAIRMRDEALEDLNSRGLVQSGVYAEAVTRLRSGELTEIQQVVGQRFGDLQNQLNQSMMAMAQARIGALGNFQGTMNNMLISDRSTQAQLGVQGAQLGLQEQGQNMQNSQYYAGLNQQGQIAQMNNATQKYGIDVGASTSKYGVDVGAATSKYGVDANTNIANMDNKFSYDKLESDYNLGKYGIDVNSADNKYSVDNRNTGGSGGGGSGGGSYSSGDGTIASMTEVAKIKAGIDPLTNRPFLSASEQNLAFEAEQVKLDRITSQIGQLQPTVQNYISGIKNGTVDSGQATSEINNRIDLAPEVKDYFYKQINAAAVQSRVDSYSNTQVKKGGYVPTTGKYTYDSYRK